MPRAAREKSLSGIYHVMLRGINKQTLFSDDEDNKKFLQILTDCKNISEYILYGYCLMGNHVHLLIKEQKESMEQIFKRIGTRYVYWYNVKYKRCGHLFQDRYKSEAINDDKYFITVLRYIHQNPLKAGICKTINNYKWSSYSDYINKNEIIDFELAFGIIGEKDFEQYMNTDNGDMCLEYANPESKLTDKELIEEIEKKINIKAIAIQNEPREIMLTLLKEILTIKGASTRQISRVTGVSVNIIWGL